MLRVQYNKGENDQQVLDQIVKFTISWSISKPNHDCDNVSSRLHLPQCGVRSPTALQNCAVSCRLGSALTADVKKLFSVSLYYGKYSDTDVLMGTPSLKRCQKITSSVYIIFFGCFNNKLNNLNIV